MLFQNQNAIGAAHNGDASAPEDRAALEDFIQAERAKIPHVKPPAPCADVVCRWQGWAVFQDQEFDRRLTYYAVHIETGDERIFDVTSYSRASDALLRRIIDAGFPKGQTSPLTLADMDAMEART